MERVYLATSKMKVDLIVFKENNKEKSIIRDCAFMNCPYCNGQLFLQTNEISFCRNSECKYLHKVAYKLRSNPKIETGFDRILSIELDNFRRTTLLDAFEEMRMGGK